MKPNKAYLEKLVELGCIVCRNLGYGYSPPEIHHTRFNVGLGQRADDYHAIPLCHAHHRNGGPGVAIHAGQKTWEEIHGSEEELLEQVRGLIRQEAK